MNTPLSGQGSKNRLGTIDEHNRRTIPDRDGLLASGGNPHPGLGRTPLGAGGCSPLLFFVSLRAMKRIHVTAVIALAMSMVPIGCENDIERVSMLTDETQVPAVKGTNIEVIYSDSARVQVQMHAPAYQQFPDVERPYMEFPEGLEVYFYDDSLRIESEIRANYAIYYTEEGLWHATGNVVANRLQGGDALQTEELFWDENKELIWSETYTRIQNEDGVFYGRRGFESDQSLNNWQLKGTSGTVEVQNEE